MNDVCSIELLRNAVARGLSAEEETALYAHLEHCEACCAQMEQLAGGEAWQQKAAALLSADELDAAVPEPANWSEVDFSVEHLDPSDDANVLGQLGGYDVLAIVGRGGMGVVLKAFDRELKRLVAIKALAPHLAHSSVARKRFAREAQAAAAVVNPHVIAIHHVQPTGRLPFLIMPLLTGESLAQRLKARGPLELTEVLRIGMQAATGLAAAHDQGLVHRDVKPANIFLEKGVERVVITDFGLARAADDVSMTRQGVVAGTPEYMSPEQARGEALDGRSDLFSLGCVLYEMATGVSPFRTDSTMATLRRIVDEQPAAMASLVPELPPWFCHIVERLLSKDPAQRFASASEVSQLLEQCLSHLQQPTSVSLPTSLVPHAAGRRSIFNSSRLGVLAMLGTIGITLLGMVLWQQVPEAHKSTDKAAGQDSNQLKEKATGKQIGSVLDKPVHESELNQNVSTDDNLERLFIRPLMESYCREHGLDRADELKTKIKDEKNRQMASFFVLRAELNRHLYEKHGGRVTLSAFGAIAFDGMRTWLDEREQAGEIKITDPQLKAKLSELWKQVPPGTKFASSDQIKVAFDPALTERFIEKYEKIPAGAHRDPAIKLVGVVFDRPIYLHDRNFANKAELPVLLYTLVVPELEERYLKEHSEVVPTDAEITGLAARRKTQHIQAFLEQRKSLENVLAKEREVDPASKGKPNTLAAIQEVDDILKRVQENDGRTQAEEMMRQLKFQEHIFDNYGGGRGLTGSQGLILLDAQKRWVEERERLGEFQIADDQLRRTLYDYWTNGPHHRGARLIEDAEVRVNFNYGLRGDAVTPLRGANGPKAAVPNDVKFYAVQDLPLWSKEGTSQHIELLIHYLEARVDSTKNGGDKIGTYDAGRGMLVVRGDGRKQRQIAQLIAELREISGQPVEDLATFNSIADLRANSAQSDEDLAMEKLVKTYFIANLPIWSKDGKKQHVDLLLSYLRFNVDPPSWESKATRVAYNAETLTLVVQGTPEVHNGINAALSRLRALDLPTEQRLEKPLDRKNARAVVEAFVAAILAGDRETAQSLAKVSAVDISDLANGLKVKRLAIETVHIGGPEKPKDVNAFVATASALAISEPVQLEGRLRPPNHTQRDGFLLFTLDMGEVGWSVNNIIFESAEGANRELRKFIEANPNSVRMSSPGGEHTVGPAGNVLAPTNIVNPPAFERIQEAKAVSPPQLFGAKTPAGVLAYDGIVQEWIGGDRRAGTILADGDAFKAVPNATIHLYRVSPITKGGAGYQFEEIEVFNSDAQGRFKINIPDDLKRFIPTPGTKEWDDWESLLLVTTSAPGFATDSTTLAANRGLDSIELIRGTSIQGRLVDELGKPVAGARITVNHQSRSSVEEMDEWLSQTSSKPLPEAKFDPSDTAAILAARKSASIANHGVQWIPTQIEGVVTDQDGRFTIDGIGPDDVLDLNVECVGYNNASIKVIGRDIETVYSRDPFSSGENIAVHGRTLQATLIASDRGSPHSRHRVIKGERQKGQVEANATAPSAKEESDTPILPR